MGTNIVTALIQGAINNVKAERQAEARLREIVSGTGVRGVIQELFPGVSQELLDSCGDVVNHLGQGVGRYVQAMTRGSLNWEWEGEGEPPRQGEPGRWLASSGTELRQALVTDALVTGKIALFPSVSGGRLRVTALSGFLWPVFAVGDASEIVALLQVTQALTAQGVRFEVRRYSPGLLEVYSDLDDWTAYATQRPQKFPQPHAPDRLPVAVRVVNRDAHREPVGLAQIALPAFRRYVKNAVLLAFLAQRGGFEERVVYSDLLVGLAKDNPQHKMLDDLRHVGVNKIRLVGSGDKYERLDPVKLAEYREAERDALIDVQSALNLPDTGGADLSGVALAEKREAYAETTEGLASGIADVMTEAHDLAATLRPAELRRGWRVTLTPRFARDVQSERAALREDYKSGGLPQSAYLSGLQSLGVSVVTDDLIEAARAAESLDAPITPDEVGG